MILLFKDKVSSHGQTFLLIFKKLNVTTCDTSFPLKALNFLQ